MLGKYLLAILIIGSYTAEIASAQPANISEIAKDFEKFAEKQRQQHAEGSALALNPFKTDVSAMEIATRINNGFQLRPNETKYVLRVTNAEGETTLDENFILLPTELGIQPDLLKSEDATRYNIRTFKIDTADKLRMNQTLEKINALKEISTGDNKLISAISYSACTNLAEDAPEQFLITMYARFEEPAFEAISPEITLSRNPLALSSTWKPCAAVAG